MKNNLISRKNILWVCFTLALITVQAQVSDQEANALINEDGVSITSKIKQVQTDILDIGYAEYGPLDGKDVILLHGWPYSIVGYQESATILADKGYHVFVPYLRGFGSTRFLSDKTVRNAQQAAVAQDIIDFMDVLKIDKAIIGGYDWGARTADVIAALWPERCTALVAVSGYLIGSPEANLSPLPPEAEFLWWYQYYFTTDRGYKGYMENTKAFNKLIWTSASPKWHFDLQTFDQSARAFENPDHVAITIHNYRWRLGLAKGEKQYDKLERRLAQSPNIEVPTITLEGDANGAPHPAPENYASKFTGKYKHYTLSGIGHNLPQEAPQAFAEAIVEADHMAQIN